MFGIRANQGETKTIDSSLRTPMIEVTSNPKRFGTLPYTFASQPPNNVAQTLFEIPHGYTYVPAAIVSYATDFQGTDIDTFSTLEFYLDDTGPGPAFDTDEYIIFAYCDKKNLYIKALRQTETSLLASLESSNWLFTYRIYAQNG